VSGFRAESAFRPLSQALEITVAWECAGPGRARHHPLPIPDNPRRYRSCRSVLNRQLPNCVAYSVSDAASRQSKIFLSIVYLWTGRGPEINNGTSTACRPQSTVGGTERGSCEEDRRRGIGVIWWWPGRHGGGPGTQRPGRGWFSSR
jgi:hypothetical protein